MENKVGEFVKLTDKNGRQFFGRLLGFGTIGGEKIITVDMWNGRTSKLTYLSANKWQVA